MKIRTPSPEEQVKVAALLRHAFPDSTYEEQLVASLRAHGRMIHEWVCIHTNMVVAYIAFTNAYNGRAVVGLHLALLAVKPEFQGQGIGSELLRFALRQEVVREKTIFVLGDPGFYRKFGFEPTATPICPFDMNNAHFLSIRNDTASPFTVGYEPEFTGRAGKVRRGKGKRGNTQGGKSGMKRRG